MLVVSYGKDAAKITYDALRASDISAYLKPEYKVAIKPNLVMAKPANDGATTHPEVVEGILLFLKEYGVKKMKIIESSWTGGNTKHAFKICGYANLSRKHGIPLLDLKSDSCTTRTHGSDSIKICDEALSADFIVNVPVLKAHCQTRMTCCMKNLKGCIPDGEKRRFHSIGRHRPIAALNMLVKTGYNVVDGICGDLSFEEGGNPVETDCVIVGRNPLTVDSYCAGLMGYKISDIGDLAYGKEMGVGEYITPDAKIIELNAQDKPLHERGGGSGRADAYRNMIDEDAACSACYSALIHALSRLGGKTTIKGGIHIGQGFKGKSGDGFGVGNCASGFAKCVPGCPARAVDIVEALKR
jgi:uncharacterized protein (DUF362 family)